MIGKGIFPKKEEVGRPVQQMQVDQTGKQMSEGHTTLAENKSIWLKRRVRPPNRLMDECSFAFDQRRVLTVWYCLMHTKIT